MSYTCLKYTVQNRSPIIPVTITWRGCNGLTRTQTLRKKSSISICALNDSVTSNFKNLTTITRNCSTTNGCANYFVTNNSSFYQTFEYLECVKIYREPGYIKSTRRGVKPGETISVCMCVPCLSASENFNFTLEKKQPCANMIPVTPTPTPYSCFKTINYDPPNQNTLVLFTDCCGNERQFLANTNSSGYGTPPEFCIQKNSAISTLKNVSYNDPCTQNCITQTPTPTPTITLTCGFIGTSYSVVRYPDLDSFCARSGGTSVTVYTYGGFIPTPSTNWNIFSDPCCKIPATGNVIYDYLNIGYTAYTFGGFTSIISPVVCPSPTPTPTNTITPTHTPTPSPTPCLETNWVVWTGDTGGYFDLIGSDISLSVSPTGPTYLQSVFQYSDLVCADKNPETNILAIEEPGIFTFTFSQSVTNPLLAVYSLGKSLYPVSISADTSFTIYCSGTTDPVYNITYDLVNQSFTGSEGFGIVQFVGTVSTIKLSYSTFEQYTQLTWGIPCVGRPTPTPTKSQTPTPTPTDPYTGVTQTQTVTPTNTPTITKTQTPSGT